MDSELVRRAQRGDEAAFSALADAVVDRLLSVARGVLGDAHLAEDATQQALLSLWRELPRLRDVDRFEAWSYRVLVNACYTEARRAHHWMPNADPALLDGRAAPDGLATVHDRDELERAFRGLSVGHRAVVVLHHYMGLTLDEVAVNLGIPIGTVRSRLFHAMRALRLVMGTGGEVRR